MRIVVLTDVHGNLPALEAALAAIRQHGYDLLVHLGEAIGIGPFPAECLDLLLALPRTRLVMDNHDAWFVQGLPTPQRRGTSNGEVQHHLWTHAQLNTVLRPVVAQWPHVLTEASHRVVLSFLHYPLTTHQEFLPIMVHPTVADFDRAFAPYQGNLIFYGHHHPFSDIQGRARYINPGSLGCAPTAGARYCLVDIAHGHCRVACHSAPYDDTPLYRVKNGLFQNARSSTAPSSVGGLGRSPSCRPAAGSGYQLRTIDTLYHRLEFEHLRVVLGPGVRAAADLGQEA